MKIAWFSPRVPEHSEIAKNTERLESELQRRFDARFFTERPDGFHEPATGQLHPNTLGRIPSTLLIALNEVDVPIYNLGNHPGYFANTWFLSQRKPGIVVLHDLKLHHFFEGIYRERLGDEHQYLAFLEEYYGAPGVEAGRLYWSQRISIDFMAEHFPMTAWGLRNALGAVVHTPPAFDAIARDMGLPAVLNDLPFDAGPLPESANERTRSGEALAERRVRLVIFGYLNVNRRVIEFFHALAAMEECARFEVHLFGTLLQRYEDDVKRDVAALGLRDQVTFHGYVSEADLDASLAECDLAVNLRYPTMGEASASQLRVWSHGLPSLVTQIDGYACLPADAVSFVRPEHEREDIQGHLRDFLTRPDWYRQRGQRGREILLARHRSTLYVEQLARLCAQLPTLRSRHTRLRMADRVGEGICAWSSGTALSRIEEHCSGKITESF